MADFSYLGCLSVLAYFLGQVSQDIEAIQDTQLSQVPHASQVGEVGQGTQATQESKTGNSVHYKKDAVHYKNPYFGTLWESYDLQALLADRIAVCDA